MTVIKCEYMYGSGIDGLWNDCNNLKSSMWTCPYAETGEFQKCKYRKLPTNADRIRSMTDEELAEMLNHAQGDGFLVGIGRRKMSAYGNWLEWLKRETEEGE